MDCSTGQIHLNAKEEQKLKNKLKKLFIKPFLLKKYQLLQK